MRTHHAGDAVAVGNTDRRETQIGGCGHQFRGMAGAAQE
jgi:hypothetical protein